MAVEMETASPLVNIDEGNAMTSIADSTDDMEIELESTQRFDDEEEEAVVVETLSIQQKPTDVVDTTNKSNAPTNEPAVEDNAFDFVGVSASARPFARAFDTVWSVMQALGWHAAQGPGTEFVSMPGTQFFNFRPNINVFDSKGKACWKWLSLAAQSDKDDVESEAVVWATLWTIAETQWGWYTMSSGDETWFVKPNTRFEQFQPNVTIFQSKKRAVLQALASQDVRIELGDSVEGEQVISFAPQPEKEVEAKETKAKAKKEKSKSSDAFTTPPPKKAPAAAQSSSKKKATPSSGKKVSGAKKSTPTKSNSKSPKTPKGAKQAEAVAVKKPEPPLNFHAPEFKCTFGQVTGKLKERGWYYKAGAFEYDYFSPDYTKETAILGGNYFQSSAELESFLKDSNLWSEIEAELRDEHEVMVEELREEAERKRQVAKNRHAAKKTSTPKAKAPRSPAKPKKKPVATPAVTGEKRSSFATELHNVSEVKITIGKVTGQLVKRGWHYKPGRFEYDYFKPNVNVKTAVLGEDYFQSETELETYLKTTGLWAEISQELQDEHTAAQERAARGGDSSEEDVKPAKKPRVSTPKAATPTAAAQSSRQEATSAAEPLEPAAAKLTNDIWGNSHEFDFEKY